MQEPRKSTLLFVQDAAAEPAALGAFAAEQPALALVTADGLDEAERKLAQLDPALVVRQCDRLRLRCGQGIFCFGHLGISLRCGFI